METFLIIISGVAVFVLGQIIQNFILESFREYKKLKNKILSSVRLYLAQILSGHIRDNPELFNMYFRQLASDFESVYWELPCLSLGIKLGFVIGEGKMSSIMGGLYGISNCVFDQSISMEERKANKMI